MQFLPGENRESLGLTGFEEYTITGIPEAVATGARARVWAKSDAGEKTFEVIVRIDTPQEAEYYRNGGILPYVVRQLAASKQFLPGENRESLGLTGFEEYTITGIPEAVASARRPEFGPSPTRARRHSRLSCESIRRRKPSIIGTAASYRMLSASSRRRLNRLPYGRGSEARLNRDL